MNPGPESLKPDTLDIKILEFKRVPKPNPAKNPPIKNSEN